MSLSLYVVGWGRMGSALALQARAGGVRLVGALSRHQSSIARARRAGVAASKVQPRSLAADLVVLAVPDGAIAAAARALARVSLSPGATVAHLSGALDLAPLAPLQGRASLGSLHPLCSVASSETPLAGASCAVDGDRAARRRLLALARAVGLRPLSRPPRDRTRYHLAASLLASGAATLADLAAEIAASAGLPRREAERALATLLASVAGNVSRLGAARALTGPVVRGDAATVARHLGLLDREPDTRALYRAVARAALALGGDGDPRGRKAISRMLSRP